MVGRLVHSKLGGTPNALAVGRQITFDGQTWTVSGRFTAAGSAFESEVWCPLADLQTALKRQDLSLVAVAMQTRDRVADVEKGDVLGQGRSRKRSGTWGSLLVAGWAAINTPAARAGILR